eukprot:comp21890_c0_seq1/m.49643 comp21890_c0_seq1/g.49643  ORF comp21890_c0_seq1/g.49643 comp21890_c0_seq1/m.49643 type:complete len:446 (-) comp21890_c0_seq1:28-1365(-)
MLLARRFSVSCNAKQMLTRIASAKCEISPPHSDLHQHHHHHRPSTAAPGWHGSRSIAAMAAASAPGLWGLGSGISRRGFASKTTSVSVGTTAAPLAPLPPPTTTTTTSTTSTASAAAVPPSTVTTVSTGTQTDPVSAAAETVQQHGHAIPASDLREFQELLSHDTHISDILLKDHPVDPHVLQGGDPLHKLEDLTEIFPREYAMHHLEMLQHLPTVEFIESMMVTMHETTGLPWWEVIMMCTFGLRMVALPFQVLLQRNTNILETLQFDIRRIHKEMEVAEHKDLPAKEMLALLREHKVHPLAPLSTMVVPFLFPPLFLSFFGAVHNLTLGHAGLATGGALWFTNLMIADASFVLPVLSGLTWLGVMELGGSQLYYTTGWLRQLCRMLSIAWIPICATLPSGVFMFWITSNIIEIIRLTIFRRDRVRDLFGIPRLSTLKRVRDAW